MTEEYSSRPGERPAHHAVKGFRNPWPTFSAPSFADFWRWQRGRMGGALAPNPAPEDLEAAAPAPARPRASLDELRSTWLGHSSWLVQLGGLNILTDPQLSPRASPSQHFGPLRFAPPGLTVDELPEIDLVLISHDHYDHLDAPTVFGLHRRFGTRIRWATPLGFSRWFERRGIRVSEMDWWEAGPVEGAEGGSVVIGCLPAQHWGSRSPVDRMARLWCSWSITGPSHRVYFGGDSGLFPEYRRIGEVSGPFDLLMLPIGAYEPRWFMRASHMNPEDAVRAYQELGGRGIFAGMHWGTFRLTDEDPLEPPARTRAAWAEANLPPESLWIPARGETRVLSNFSP